jgi:ribosomal protein S28E/S33
MEKPDAKKVENSCCGENPVATTPETVIPKGKWICGTIKTTVGDVPRVKTKLDMHDRLSTLKVRLNVGRMRYTVAPGLYGVGNPNAESNIFVTANFKLTFDKLRVELDGMDAWILVLDTLGINVWCAAGKGTFGTDELVGRIETVGLDRIVSHRRLILPQLGATGVCAHEVKNRSGFRVIYGPVRAKDIPAFLDARMKATPAMRRVRVIYGPVRAKDIPAFLDARMKATPAMRRVKFTLWDRVVLIPVEIVETAKYALLVAAVLLILSGLGTDGYSLARVKSFGLWSAGLWLAAWLLGLALTPALLPLLPGRAFSTKGAIVGLLIILAVGWYAWGHPDIFVGWIVAGAWIFLIPAMTSFTAMNFTGASTYTSLSGVKKEMRVAVPMQITFAAIGTVAWITGLFVGKY